MSELSVAVVGCGAAGNVHLQCWRNLSGVRVSAICDSNGSVAAKTAADFPGVAAFQDVKALLKSSQFDIVDVCTSPVSQFEVVRSALNAGCHVLCESPFTLDSDSVDKMIRLAETRERHLSPAFCHRFHAPVIFAKDLVENDELGRPTMFRCRFSGYWEEAAEDRTRSSVGALRATAIHAIDLFRYLCGNVKTSTGLLKNNNRELTVEDTVCLMLESESGTVGVIEICWTSPGGRNVLEIYGTAGSCIVDYDTGITRFLTADQPVWQHKEAGGPNRFEREIASFADVVRGLQSPAITAADGAAAAQVCDRIYAGFGKS